MRCTGIGARLAGTLDITSQCQCGSVSTISRLARARYSSRNTPPRLSGFVPAATVFNIRYQSGQRYLSLGPLTTNRWLSTTHIANVSNLSTSGTPDAGSTIPTTPIEDGFPLPLPRAIGPSSALLLLSVPVAPEHWPSHLDFASPLLARLSKSLKGKGVLVNAVYDGISNANVFPEVEEYPARLYFPDGKMFKYESLGKAAIGEDGFLRDLSYKPADRRTVPSSRSISSVSEAETIAASKDMDVESVDQGEEGLEVVVCSHGSRDCRCADRGGALVKALKEEISRRGVGKRVKVSEIAHVGGHKYAANAILLPSLDMLSNLLPSHAPSLLSHILSGRPESSQMWQHWRGRYGLTESEQATVWASVDPDADKSSAGLESGQVGSPAVAAEVRLVFKTWEGDVKEVIAKTGETLLEVARREGLPSMEGVCGGHLECATCHVYLIPPSSTKADPPVSDPSEEEDDMLGYALGFREGESRLGCQIKVDQALGDWCASGGIMGLPRF